LSYNTDRANARGQPAPAGGTGDAVP
jgi:hypothetical protein